MNLCLFVSDLHGSMSRFESLIKYIRKERPEYVFIGGDILPHNAVEGRPGFEGINDFIIDFLIPKFTELKKIMDCAYPEIFITPGNNDRRDLLNALEQGEKKDLWHNLHQSKKHYGKYTFYGYGCVPLTPFALKDWERYDIDNSIPAGSIGFENGTFSVPPEKELFEQTIEGDLDKLCSNEDQTFGVWLFHTPPHQSEFDLIKNANGNDLHVGSKAVADFINKKQPYITLHGHIHESFSLSGKFYETNGRTHCYSSSHIGSELAVIRFELHAPKWVERIVI